MEEEDEEEDEEEGEDFLESKKDRADESPSLVRFKPAASQPRELGAASVPYSQPSTLFRMRLFGPTSTTNSGVPTFKESSNSAFRSQFSSVVSRAEPRASTPLFEALFSLSPRARSIAIFTASSASPQFVCLRASLPATRTSGFVKSCRLRSSERNRMLTHEERS